MPPVGFEPTIPASERPQTYALDRAATETGIKWLKNKILLDTSISLLSLRTQGMCQAICNM